LKKKVKDDETKILQDKSPEKRVCFKFSKKKKKISFLRKKERFDMI